MCVTTRFYITIITELIIYYLVCQIVNPPGYSWHNIPVILKTPRSSAPDASQMWELLEALNGTKYSFNLHTLSHLIT